MQQAADDAIERQVARFTGSADLAWVVAILTTARATILDRWLVAVTAQPFHADHREHAITDHIPALYDALVAFLARGAARAIDTGVPLDDAAVLAAAEAHARSRMAQGLRPVDVVTEFRLLRQETLGLLRQRLPASVPTRDILAAELLINDALDGAMSVGLRALTDQVEAVREEFLATTIHDVRQPLTLIKGTAQATSRQLRRAGPEHAPAVAALEVIDTLATRMGALLTMLTDASRIALRHLHLDRGPVNIVDLAEAVRQQIGPTDAARVRLVLAPDADPVGVWDRLRLEQVLTNLLTNAVKYSPAGSPIEVVLGGDPAWLELSVADAGMGVAAQDLPHIFERYHRAAVAVDQGIEGLGLGLYLCRGIVEAHGGRIWATSPGPGAGLTVHLVLPRHRPGAARAWATPGGTAGPGWG